MLDVSTKTCSTCKEVKPLSDFYRDATRPDGRDYDCKACKSVKVKPYNAEYHDKKRESINQGRRKRYWRRRDKELETIRKYHRENADKIRAAGRAKHERDPRINMLANAKTRSKRSGIIFDLSLTDFAMPDRCPVFGEPFVIGIGKSNKFSPTLDRIDNNNGYIKGNVIVVSLKANTIKNSSTPDEVRMVADFYSRLLGKLL